MSHWAPPPVINIKDLVPNAAALSERRQKVLFEILPEVLGGSYAHGTGGNAKWTRLSAGYNPTSELQRDKDNGKPGPHTTTCGALPKYVALALGVPEKLMHEKIASGGLNAVRTAAQLQGAWVKNSAFLQMLAASAGQSGQRPLPGDIYCLCETRDPDSIVVHIGIIVSTGLSPTDINWWTADAGQGKWPDQECRLVQRNYEPATSMLTGESTTGLVRNKKLIGGWVDIDKYPFKS